MTFNVYNSGAVDSGRIAVDFYLSGNTTVLESDVFVERRLLDSLPADAFTVATTELTIPRDAPVGMYYLGWMMRAEEMEYSTANNSALFGDHRLRVAVAPTPTATLPPTPTATASPEPTLTATEPMPTAPATFSCLGDCRGDSRVTVDEVVLMVAIGLGTEQVDAGPIGDGDRDGQVAISEVISSVRHALEGCGVTT